jgi:hypothetical protein
MKILCVSMAAQEMRENFRLNREGGRFVTGTQPKLFHFSEMSLDCAVDE